MADQSPPNQLDVEPIVTIEGVVDRLVFENADTGFLVGRLSGRGQHLDTFVGTMIAVSPGETVRLRGRWVDDNRFGRQLRVESFETILPSTVEGVEKYLGSGLIEGIGPTFAKRLVKAFGIETLRVIDEEPTRLRGVPGIGPKRAAQIRKAWASQKAIQSIMVFLQGHGISTNQAVKIYKTYGDRAVAVLRENPYRLADDIAGIAFAGADKIAGRLGIGKDAPERMRAGLLHVVTNTAQDGHVFARNDDVCEAAAELLGVEGGALPAPLGELVARGTLVREGEALFLPKMHRAECQCAHWLKRLIRTPHDTPSIKTEAALQWVEKRESITLSPEQREAIREAVRSKVVVITGGPGTGKTTVIRSLLAIFGGKGVSYLLAAPTGRAAKRMESATDQPACTIHRLLEYAPRQNGFQRNAAKPLVTDMVVIDEMSMVDVQLMEHLLEAIPPFARLVLVGDIDQLPSVGAGNVLLDIIASQVVPVVRLRTVFRQAEQSGIISNAHLINEGKFPAFNTSDFVLVQRPEPSRAVETVIELVTRRIPDKFGLDPLRDIQVLAPMRRGEAGVIKLNEALQTALNPNGLPVPRRRFRQGDRVMQLRNNYNLDVYNGDTGIVQLVDTDAGELEIAFDDGRVVLYAFDQCDNLDLAYAATVHKSQGSEYPAVVLPMLSQHYMMLQRNLLYTAVTRSKRLVVIVGESKAVGMAVRNSRIVRRNTMLVDRLRNTASN